MDKTLLPPLIFRILKTFTLIFIAYILFLYRLEQDEIYGNFYWIESPNSYNFMIFISIFISVMVWILTKKLITGKKLLNLDSSFKLFLESLRIISSGFWYVILLIVGLLFFQNPPAKILVKHKVKVLDIYTPQNQSKPYKSYIKITSWRGKKYEILSTIEWKNTEKIKKNNLVIIYLGMDWMGQKRVLNMKLLSKKRDLSFDIFEQIVIPIYG